MPFQRFLVFPFFQDFDAKLGRHHLCARTKLVEDSRLFWNDGWFMLSGRLCCVLELIGHENLQQFGIEHFQNFFPNKLIFFRPFMDVLYANFKNEVGFSWKEGYCPQTKTMTRTTKTTKWTKMTTKWTTMTMQLEMDDFISQRLEFILVMEDLWLNATKLVESYWWFWLIALI